MPRFCSKALLTMLVYRVHFTLRQCAMLPISLPSLQYNNAHNDLALGSVIGRHCKCNSIYVYYAAQPHPPTCRSLYAQRHHSPTNCTGILSGMVFGPCSHNFTTPHKFTGVECYNDIIITLHNKALHHYLVTT